MPSNKAHASTRKLTALIVAILITALGASSRAAIYTVNTSTDLDDGVCDATHCSLREAINLSNTPGNVDEIHFALQGTGPNVIHVTSALPTITDPAVIDGYTQLGSDSAKGHPTVVITGSATYGLYVSVGAVTIRGLVIQGFNIGMYFAFADDAVVQGNFIGTDVTGTSSAGNIDGIWFQLSNNILLGGAAPGDRNLISGNSDTGVRLLDASGARVHGNLIGVDLSGKTVLANGGTGVQVDGSTSADCLIGGPGPGEGNVIAGSAPNVDVHAGLRTIIQGNFIGTDRTGTLDLSDGSGVGIFQAADCLVGGPNAGEGNIIAFNDIGISSAGNSTTAGNSFRGNRVFRSETLINPQLGIDLLGNQLTVNDHCDPDGAFNNLQNFPVLTVAASNASSITLEGQLDSVADQEYTLDFFANRECDPSGHGEGEWYLGNGTVTTDASCIGTFSVSLPKPVADGMAITATATAADGSTSEFSACWLADGAPGSGSVPDGSIIGAVPLTVAKETGEEVTLTWSPSCHPNDNDYEVYGGTIGIFYDHEPIACTTTGMTTYTFNPADNDRYYLVVPREDSIEGSYGLDSLDSERPQLAGACMTHRRWARGARSVLLTARLALIRPPPVWLASPCTHKKAQRANTKQ